MRSIATSYAAAKRKRALLRVPLGDTSRGAQPTAPEPAPPSAVPPSDDAGEYLNRDVALKRSVPFDRNPTSGSDLWIIVPDGEMLNAAIIPNDNRMRSPAKPHLEICACAVLE